MRIEFGELRIGKTAKAHMQDVMNSNWASAGPKVKAFEEGWSNLFNYQHSAAVSSGTDACINAVLSLYATTGAVRGDEVIVPALSFIATSNAVLAAGFKPVFVDIKASTLNINPSLIEAAITPRTRAIFVVHTMGKPCDMDPILAIAKKHNLQVLEDCCESHGARYKGQFIGSFGTAACFSFYIAHLICCGEGGMVSTNFSSVYNSVRSTRSHGRKPDDLYFDHLRFGLNSKMNDMEASLGLEGIENFWNTYRTRKYNWYYLYDKLSKYEDVFYMNKEESYENMAPHAFTLTFRKNNPIETQRLSDYLTKKDIKVKRNFGCIPTQHRAFAWMNYSKGEFPESEHVGDNGLHFGVHQYLNESDLEYIVESVNTFFSA